jgi:hypothetical protein
LVIRPDLLAWADSCDSVSAEEAGEAAEVAAFPVLNHMVVEKLARRFARYDERRAAFFLKQEISRLTLKRQEKGVPRKIAIQDSVVLEQAVWVRISRLGQQRGGAA